MMLNNIVGQQEVKNNLNILIESSRGGTLPHILLTGAPGLGKSSIARAVADEMGYKFTEVNSAYTGGGSEAKIKMMIALEDIKENDIIFLDEIHNLSKNTQEMLYTAIEDGYINYGDLFGSKKMLPPFTLIGATTDIAGLTRAMQSRFKHIIYLREYNEVEICQIIAAEAVKLKISIDQSLAGYCRGNPRQTKNHIDWVSRYCKVKNIRADRDGIREAMLAKNIYKYGLTQNDINYITLLKKKKVMGVRNISNTLGVEEKTVKNNIEPYLMKLGLIYLLSVSGKRQINMDKCIELGL